MQHKLRFVVLFICLFTSYLTFSQTVKAKELVRSTTGVSGSSENIKVNNQTYNVQQSFGQASPIGTYSNSNNVVRQGFIQPDVLSKIIDIDIPLNLEATIYPNPFVKSISLSFTETVSNEIEVAVFDMVGRLVFSNNYNADQNIKIQLTNLSVADYILKVTANNKQFIKKILKK